MSDIDTHGTLPNVCQHWSIHVTLFYLFLHWMFLQAFGGHSCPPLDDTLDLIYPFIIEIRMTL